MHWHTTEPSLLKSSITVHCEIFQIKHRTINKRVINRGYLLFRGENQIYFIECGEKISIFYECAARVKMLIFSPHEMKYIWYLPKKKVNFLFILYST